MKLLVIVMTLLLCIGLLMFTTTNLETRVTITVMNTLHPDVRLIAIVFIAIFTGIVYASIIGVAEGVSLRLANRRLRREIDRIEAELAFLRRQPARGAHPEPDAPTEPSLREVPPEEPELTGVGGRELASAPVYEAGDYREDDDPDDDAYSGGRAV